MNHSALKTEIIEMATTASAQRREATTLLNEGRKLRREGNSDQGWAKHREGMALRWDANDEREYRRHLHLAAALLNGRPYLRCEAKYDEEHTGPALSGLIGRFIKPHLPESLDAADIAAEWLSQGNVRLRYDKDSDALSLVPAEMKEAA